MVHGRPGVERLDLNIDTLWSGGPLPAEQGPPPSRLLPAPPETVRNGDFDQADGGAQPQPREGAVEEHRPAYGALPAKDAAGREFLGLASVCDADWAVASRDVPLPVGDVGWSFPAVADRAEHDRIRRLLLAADEVLYQLGIGRYAVAVAGRLERMMR